MKKSTGIAVIESKWWRGSNVSVRSMFDLVADIATRNPHGYHYEMANSEAALKEAIPRVARYRDCRYLCLAMHGDTDGLRLINDERLSRTELRNLLTRVKATPGSKLAGVYLSSCIFGTHYLADFVFQQDAGVSWIAGYSEEVNFIDSSALDLLFFNHLVWEDASTEGEKIKAIAKRIAETAPGLARELGFGIYVRKQGTGGREEPARANPRRRGCVMEFRIADTFTDSLVRLTGQEQKAVKTTAFDLQMNPSSPGLSFHKLDRAKDPNFWSVRVNADIRLIVHRTASSILLAYVDHHDDAYKWAERRKIERHPTTGAMQMVEVRELVEEVAPAAPIPTPSTSPAVAPRLFDNLRKFELMSFGVPEEWVEDVRAATDETLFDLLEHLPQEAQEALLKLAVGEQPVAPQPAPADADPFAHPDAQRRFRVLTNVEELERALDSPWEKWAVFLHPAQRQTVERDYSGPARVTGSAGTGKTIVALHRAVHLARKDPAARILLTTFSKPLANALKVKLAHLVSNEAALSGRITTQALTGVGYDLYASLFGQPNIAPTSVVQSLIAKAAEQIEGQRFTRQFLFGEWADVVDAWGLRTWEDYRDVSRLGRKTRIGGKQRETLWAIFEEVRAGLGARKQITWSDLFGRLADHYGAGAKLPFDHVVVDEAQDISVAEARFLGALAQGRPQALFFAGDIGQRIFQQPFSWKSLGIDVRGRSSTLRINYRTSHQIRSHADRLLPGTVTDVDGNAESRRGTVSVFDGAEPQVISFATADAEQAAVGAWIAQRLSDGCRPHEIALFVRSDAELRRARAAAKASGAQAVELSEKIEVEPERLAISTMHFAKGLEFRAVAVMACDDEVIPSQERIERVADDADLEEVYDTERHLLYVACTRARDHLLVTGVDPASEFLDDFGRG